MSREHLRSFPWEEAHGLWGLTKALFATCRLILVKPLDFFRSIKDVRPAFLRKRLAAAVAFALTMGYLKLFLDVIETYWLAAFGRGIFPSAAVQNFSVISSVMFGSSFFLLRPVVILAGTLGIVVLGVKLVFGFDKLLVPALLVVCYKSAADIFYFVPVIGSVLAGIWSLVLVAVGLSVMYSAGLGRSVLAGILVPLAILFLVLLSAGPALNTMLLSFYPEAQPQWRAFNDLNAYASFQTIDAAIGRYHSDLGFYPERLGLLEKYIDSGIVREALRSRQSAGYGYDYTKVGDEGFRLLARPLAKGQTGRFVFFTDSSGVIRLNGPSGPEIKGAQEMERLAAEDASAGGQK